MINSTRVRDLNNWCFGNFEEAVNKVSRSTGVALTQSSRMDGMLVGKTGEISSWTRQSSVGFFRPPLRAARTILISVHSDPIFIWFRV